ncbi:MAG: pilus assembly protein PilM, partial [Gammaproteobacteria bacterium]|nr:pilus assembly protein PilM [Gammaproteobacteria bacterium]
MSLLKRKQPVLLGLDISSTTVKLLELSCTNGQYKVESMAIEPLPDDAVSDKDIQDTEAVGECIQKAL